MTTWQVVFYERDINQVKAGEKKELLYTTVTGIKSDLSGPQQVPDILERQSTSSEPTSSDGSDTEDEEGNGVKKFISSARPRDESPNSKKVFLKMISNIYFKITN